MPGPYEKRAIEFIKEKFPNEQVDRSGNPISVEKWAELSNDLNYVTLAQSMLITTWIGAKKTWTGEPRLFETALIDLANQERIPVQTYSTEAEAVQGHESILRELPLMYAELSSRKT